MSFHLISDIAGMNQINFSLNNVNWYSLKKVDQAIVKLSQLLHGLELHVKAGFTPMTEILRGEIVEILGDLDRSLIKHECGALSTRVKTVKEKILNLKSVVDFSPSVDKPTTGNLPAAVAFFCDLDCPDYNGAVAESLKLAIEQYVPFITTRSLLRGSDWNEGGICCYIDVEMLLWEEQENWEIYQKGEMLVFMPKAFLPGHSGEEKLAALDFICNDSLRKISIKEALQGPQAKATIYDVMGLFSDQPKADKVFYLMGHGGHTTVGALDSEHYAIFLKFLEAQHCQGLAVTSCLSGGKSCLFNIPEATEDLIASFYAQEKPHSFAILVHSIGDFPTHNSLGNKNYINQYLKAFAVYVKGSTRQPISQLQHSIKAIEKGLEKHPRSLIKLYPAHSQGIPGGFRPLGEGSKSIAVTYTMVKRAEISPVIPWRGLGELAPEVKIEIGPAEYIELHPLVIPVPLILRGTLPALLSMIPGQGHHFIKAIKMCPNLAKTPLELIKHSIEFHRSSQNRVSKGIFIAEISLQQTVMTHVVLYMSNSKSFCIWREGETYYRMSGGVTREVIPPLTYAIIVYEVIGLTTAGDKAIRSLSGGQECEELFQDAINEAHFYPEVFDRLFDRKQKPLVYKTDCSEAVRDLVRADNEQLVVFFLKCGKISEALELYLWHMSKQSSDCFGSSLLNLAISAQALDLVELLLQQEIDVNECDLQSTPPLICATAALVELYELQDGNLKQDDEKIVNAEAIFDLLLHHHAINLEATDASGWTAVVIALYSSKVLAEKLIEKGAKINYCNGHQGCSPLSHFVSINNVDRVDFLLEYGANPNLGNPCPLNEAIYLNDLSLVVKLLGAGAKSFVIDAGGRVPFIEATLRASNAIVNLLVKQEDSCSEIQDREGLFPMLAALLACNDEKIRLLKMNQMEFPKRLKKNVDVSWDDIFELLWERRYTNEIIELLQANYTGDFAEKLISQLLWHTNEKKLSFLYELISQGHISIGSSVTGGNPLFVRILLKGIYEPDKYRKLTELCLEKGADLNMKCNGGITLIDHVVMNCMDASFRDMCMYAFVF